MSSPATTTVIDYDDEGRVRGQSFAATVIEAATRAIDLNGSREAAQAAMRAAGVTLA